MSKPRWIVFALALSAAFAAWVLTPPYPRPDTLLDQSLTSLTTRFGPPNGPVPVTPLSRRLGKSVVWETQRLVAVWDMQVYLHRGSADSMEYVDSAFRCLSPKWVSEPAKSLLSFSCDGVAEARVMAPNPRLEWP